SGPNSDRECEPCGPETFSTINNATSCTPWSPCEAGTTQSVEPTASRDRSCSACGEGKYEAEGSCQDLTECGDDEYEAEAPTATRDRQCVPLTVCEAGERVSQAPTA